MAGKDKDQEGLPVVVCYRYKEHRRIIVPGYGVAIQLIAEADHPAFGPKGIVTFPVLLMEKDARILAESLRTGADKALQDTPPPKAEQN